MITDRDLDARLADAAGVNDADLPALPGGFLDLLRDGDAEPASVVAARQLVADAHADRTRPRRRRGVAVRLGVAAVAVAAAWTAVVVATPPDRSTPRDGGTAAPASTSPSGAPIETPANGIALVAAEQVAFPFTLDPAPPGLTPTFSQWGGVPPFQDQLPTSTADYRSAGGGGVSVAVYPEDPRPSGTITWPGRGARVSDVTVAGSPAQVATDADDADLLWHRPDGRWVQIDGSGTYRTAEAVVRVAESLVDRPQPVPLQFGLAPAGWTLDSLEESRSIDLSSDADPQRRLTLSRYDDLASGVTVDRLLEGMTPVRPVETVPVQGRSARLALAQPGGDGSTYWYVAGEFPDGSLFLLLTPPDFTRDQVLEIAGQVTYNG